MARFFIGFLAATGLWAATLGVLYSQGIVALASDEEPAELDAAPAEAAAEAPAGDPKRRRKLKRTRIQGGSKRAASSEARAAAALPQGEATTGDNIDWAGDRQVDMGGGEAQLSGTAIEAGFDSAMGRIRRCLVLVPAEGEVSGKLTFGMRVGGDGQPRAVNLSGPAVVTSGESGSCLRQAAQSIRFAKFDGPDMLFKYPITLQ